MQTQVVKAVLRGVVLGLGLLAYAAAAIADTPEVPNQYRPLYREIDAKVDAFTARIDGQWDRRPYGTTFSAELLAANFNRGEELLRPDAARSALAYADALKRLGFTGVTISVGIPVLEPTYPKFAQYLQFYKHVMAGLRVRGMRVMIEDGLIIPNPAFSTVGVTYHDMTLDKFADAEIAVGKTVVDELKPDYVQVANEPNVLASITGISALNDPQTFANFAKRIATPLRGHGVLVGGGTGNWNDSDFMKALVQAGAFDYYDLHLYYPEGFDNALALLDVAATSAKPLTISECWLEKTTKTFDAGLLSSASLDAYSQVASRSSYLFWAPLDAKFLGALMKLSYARKLAFVSPFWSKYFFAQIPYSQALAPAAALRQSDLDAAQALTTGRSSPLGAFMEKWLHVRGN